MPDAYRRDIEESDEVLDAEDAYAVDFWESKQRELVTSVVDYNLSTLTDLVGDGTIDLSPGYQRRFRWDEVRQSQLIESFLMNVPVPPVFLNEDEYGKYSIIDGKQRLNAIYRFMRGSLRLKKLTVFADIEGCTYEDLPRKLQNVLRTRPTLRAVIILRQSDSDVKFHVFQRLNTGGVHLNPQEIRNSAYTGPLNDTILKLSCHPAFHRLLGIKIRDRSAIYREMRDAEFVLRFFTFRKCWRDFTGGMKRSMDSFMAENRFMEADELGRLKADFVATLQTVEDCFGEHAFKRWVPERSQWRQQVIASLYDAQMFACRRLQGEGLGRKQAVFVRQLKKLFEDGAFRKAIDAATNTPSYFTTRIAMVRKMLRDALKQ